MYCVLQGTKIIVVCCSAVYDLSAACLRYQKECSLFAVLYMICALCVTGYRDYVHKPDFFVVLLHCTDHDDQEIREASQ